MVRGASQSQSSSSSTSRPGIAAPRGSAAATAGIRRRRLGGSAAASSSSIGGGGSGPGGNMLRFYTDEAPGMKISPTVVLVMSLCFIGFVTGLHVFGKLYRSRSGSGEAWSSAITSVRLRISAGRSIGGGDWGFAMRLSCVSSFWLRFCVNSCCRVLDLVNLISSFYQCWLALAFWFSNSKMTVS